MTKKHSLILLLASVSFLLGYFLFKNLTLKEEPLIKSSEISRQARGVLADFLEVASLKANLPEEIVLNKVVLPGREKSLEFVGNWTKDGKPFFVLLALNQEKRPIHLRFWTFKPSEVLNSDTGYSALNEIANSTWLFAKEDIACQELKDPETQQDVTICGLVYEKGKEKRGASVKGPIETPDGKKIIMVSLCKIPSEASSSYSSSYCL